MTTKGRYTDIAGNEASTCTQCATGDTVWSITMHNLWHDQHAAWHRRHTPKGACGGTWETCWDNQ